MCIRDRVNILDLNEEKREFILEYKDKNIFLMATNNDIKEKKSVENGEIKHLTIIMKAGYEKGKNNYKISIPLQVAKMMQLDKIDVYKRQVYFCIY